MYILFVYAYKISNTRVQQMHMVSNSVSDIHIKLLHAQNCKKTQCHAFRVKQC